MKIDTHIIEQYDNFILEGKYKFFINTPIFNRLKEVGLIEDTDEITEEMLNLALIEVLNQPNMTEENGSLKVNGLIIYREGIEHPSVKKRALLIKDRVLIRKCFEKLRDEKKDISNYLK